MIKWYSFIVVVCLCCYAASCRRATAPTYTASKICGLNLVASPQQIDSTSFLPIKAIHAGWVAVIPYGFCRENDPHFYFNSERQWWGETLAGTAHTIKLAQQNGLKVMLKPHAWVARGTYTGDFDLKTEQEWQIFEKDFGNYILSNARLADSLQVELFCMATEMDNFVRKRPTFWKNIISQIRKVYKGKLTYADNWNHFQHNHFWADLDYIGIDAYFPLSNQKQPTIETLQKGWKPHLEVLEELSAQYQKPILFTEIGYRSVDFAADKPWESNEEKPENLAIQAATYKAFFSEVWQQKWLAGAFIWKWFMHPPHMGKFHRDAYSPQEKPALEVLKEAFGKEKKI